MASRCLGSLADVCTTCVSQGVAYAGGSVVFLRLMAARASRRTAARADRSATETAAEPERIDDHPTVDADA